MKFAVMGVFKVLETESTKFKEDLIWHSENTWQESGSLKFVVYVDENDSSVFYLYELFEDRSDYEKHIKTDYISVFKEKITPLLREPVQIFRGVPAFSNPKSKKGEI